MLNTEKNINNVYKDIKLLINNSKEKIYRTVNTEIINLYWNIGKIIVEIQEGKERAKYGDKVLEKLSNKLTNEFGNGFSKDNLERMRKFYLMFGNSAAMLRNLTWSHYLQLMSIKEKEKRNFYMHECINSRWSVRELQRQIKSNLYDRLLISKNKDKINELSEKGLVVNDGSDLLKDPYVLEFLKLNKEVSEKDLEN